MLLAQKAFSQLSSFRAASVTIDCSVACDAASGGIRVSVRVLQSVSLEIMYWLYAIRGGLPCSPGYLPI